MRKYKICREADFFDYWYIKFSKASFVFIDELDAFYHFRVAENLVKKVREVKGVQIFMTTHNTDLMRKKKPSF